MISLSLQGAGGALSAAATTNQESQAGIAIMLSGLSFQVFTLIVFSSLSYGFHAKSPFEPDKTRSVNISATKNAEMESFHLL